MISQGGYRDERRDGAYMKCSMKFQAGSAEISGKIVILLCYMRHAAIPYII